MKNNVRKIGQIIRGDRVLRTLALLCVIFVLLGIGFLWRSVADRKEERLQRVQIQQNELTFENLKKMAQAAEAKQDAGGEFFEKKSFANFEEVIPFIAYLEKLFAPLDPEAQITIKSQEGQIFVDHFADYSIDLKAKPEKVDFLFKAMDQIFLSRFIVKVMSFSMVYIPSEEKQAGDLKGVSMVIRLYIK